MPALEVDGLTKTFQTTVRRPNDGASGLSLKRLLSQRQTVEVEAVRDISFAIEAGERVAFIGPNGAGKSTTLKMLSGILYPSAGDARVMGHQPWSDVRQMAYKIGIVFGQRTQLWPHLPVRSSYELLAEIYGVEPQALEARLRELAEIFDIAALLDRPARSLSLGQRMRSEIVAALLHAPSVLFLDEPTIGLDVTAKAMLRDHLKRLSENDGLTLLLTSHDTGDIEEITERVILINRGEKLIDEPVSRLRANYLQHKVVTLATEDPNPEFDHPGVTVLAKKPHELMVQVDLKETSAEQVIRRALDALSIRDIAIENAPLEDIIKQIYAAA